MKQPSATREQGTATAIRDKVALFLIGSGLASFFLALPVMVSLGMTAGCGVVLAGFVMLAVGADLAGKGAR